MFTMSRAISLFWWILRAVRKNATLHEEAILSPTVMRMSFLVSLLVLVLTLVNTGICFALPESHGCCKPQKTATLLLQPASTQKPAIVSCCAIEPADTLQSNLLPLHDHPFGLGVLAAPVAPILSLGLLETRLVASSPAFIADQSDRYLTLRVLLN